MLLDIVPNHMAASDENPFWADEALRGGSSTSTRTPAATGASSRSTSWPGCARRTRRSSRPPTPSCSGLVAEGLVDGLRIDHPDGLADPPEYLRRLADRGVARVWVEKILEPGEELPDWPVEGTTGYEFMADATGLFVDPAGEAPLTALYAEITGERRPFAEVAAEAKLARGAHHLPARGRAAADRCSTSRRWPTRSPGLPVYRTYVEPGPGEVEAHDVEAVEEAELPERVREALVPRATPTRRPSRSASSRPPARSWPRASRTPPSTATCGWSRSTRSAPTPGAGARRRPRSTRATPRAARRFPRGLLATQTHDTKRSGDVRARIGALAGDARRLARAGPALARR